MARATAVQQCPATLIPTRPALPVPHQRRHYFESGSPRRPRSHRRCLPAAMEGEGRARRATAGTTRGRAGAKSALQELAELRKSGAKRVDRYELKEEEAVYELVEEAEYAKLVQKRREEGGACYQGCWAGRSGGDGGPGVHAGARAPARPTCRPPVAVCSRRRPCRRLCDRRGRPGLCRCGRGD